MKCKCFCHYDIQSILENNLVKCIKCGKSFVRIFEEYLNID